MCRKCEGRVAAIMAVLLSAAVPDLSGDGHGAHERDVESFGDVAETLRLIAPVIRSENPLDEPTAPMTDHMVSLGVQRLGNAAALADYMLDAVKKAFDVAVDTMQARAKAGDLRAVAWLLANAEMLSQYGIEVVAVTTSQEVRHDDVSFMRPRGARPPVS